MIKLNKERLGTAFLRVTSAILLAVLLMAVASPVLSAKEVASSDRSRAGYERGPVTLDGRDVISGESYLIGGVTYVPLRALAEAVGAESVQWNASTSTATVIKGDVTLYVTDGAYYLHAEGRYFYAASGVRNLSGRLYVPIRPIAKAFSLEVYWDVSTRSVSLRSTGRALTHGSAYYDSDDLYWLSRIISAESAGEPFVGQIAVGNVVLNRVASRSYPNTVYGVIFDRKGGVQFTPAATGTVYRSPTASAVIAAKICLEGYTVDGSILFFMNPRIATNNWISRNRPFAFRLGNHDFYY